MLYSFNLGLLFEDIALKNADNISLRYENSSVTYSEINKLANKIAHFLVASQIKTKDVVGIFNDKTPIGYASMIACLKIGATYTNIDENNPKERLNKIFEQCQPKLLLIDHKPSDDFKNHLNEENLKLSELSKDFLKDYDDNNLELTKLVTGAVPAYIMFTSGSTGVPKGVVISHANIISFLNWSIPCYNISSKDIFAQLSPVYFDNSVFDFYTALFAGASLAPISKELLKSPLELVKYIDKLECSIWFSVPSLLIYLLTMRVLRKDTMNTIRVFTFGGEGFPKVELKKLYDLYKEKARFVNVYGPTEGTCICSFYDITDKDFENFDTLPPLGKINPNFDYLILDDDEKPANLGEKGELCILGSNISMGYYNSLEQTQKSFVKNPMQPNYTEIMYKTGDLVKEEDGLLWFIGRKDNQIKHMGYRIELEEIENAINQLDYISQSAAIYQRSNVGYGKIIAFVATSENKEEKEVREDLKKYLPDYMLPNIIEIKDMLPKNANGKIDKKKLTSDFNQK
ncbi:MAG: amino acid adenylation domain-containing protein [Alphaproteobacteria bacterium]